MAAASGINLEVWFPQQDVVTVLLESSLSDADDERFFETSVFALFAARQISSTGGFTGSSLSEVLFSFSETNPVIGVESYLAEMEVQVGSPSGRGGHKGFTAEFRPEERNFFKLHGHGFGMLGKGVDYYAPTSTVALLWWLLRHRQDDQAYQRALGTTAKAVGAAGVSGMISVRSNAQIAMQAAAGGWFTTDSPQPEGAAPPTEEFELSPEAVAAAAAHSINFADLYAGTLERLGESMAALQAKEGSHTIFRTEDIKRMCRFEVLLAAGLMDEDEYGPLQFALDAVDIAAAQGNERIIEAMNANRDKVMAEVIDEEGLAPLVDALESELFTDDPYEAFAN